MIRVEEEMNVGVFDNKQIRSDENLSFDFFLQGGGMVLVGLVS
jgi:hypothetical protein